jgi:hypothetical protein
LGGQGWNHDVEPEEEEEEEVSEYQPFRPDYIKSQFPTQYVFAWIVSHLTSSDYHKAFKNSSHSVSHTAQ